MHLQSSMCSSPLKGKVNPAASGSFLYDTHDKQYIIKSLTSYEVNQFNTIADSYFEAMRRVDQGSLLLLICGIYGHTDSGQQNSVMIMRNVFPPHKHIEAVYDFKGSTYGREVGMLTIILISILSPNNRFLQATEDEGTFRDVNFKTKFDHFLLKPMIFKKFKEMLDRDFESLIKMKLSDYSFLLGIHHGVTHDVDDIDKQDLYVFPLQVNWIEQFLTIWCVRKCAGASAEQKDRIFQMCTAPTITLHKPRRWECFAELHAWVPLRARRFSATYSYGI